MAIAKPAVDVVELEDWEKPRKSLLDYHLDQVAKDVPVRVCTEDVSCLTRSTSME